MKCVHVTKYGGSDVLKVVDGVSRPSPNPNEILVRVRSVGVNPVDTYVSSGSFLMKPALPYIPSSDVAGEVVALGDNVKESKFAVGRRVFGYIPSLVGGTAEYAVIPSKTCGTLPDDISFEQGAAIGIPYFTAYDALFKIGNAKSGDKVLIHGGSGGVGMAAIDLALARGIDVYATAGTEEGLEKIKAKGVKNVFNHRKPGYCNEIKKANDNKGMNLILEMLANVNLCTDCDLIANFGKILVIGSRGEVEKFDPFSLMAKASSVHGVAILLREENELTKYVQDIEEMLHKKQLSPLIGGTYSFGDVRQLHDDLMSDKGKQGKLVLSVD